MTSFQRFVLIAFELVSVEQIHLKISIVIKANIIDNNEAKKSNNTLGKFEFNTTSIHSGNLSILNKIRVKIVINSAINQLQPLNDKVPPSNFNKGAKICF